jgi:4-alpha-glucanotransferase
VSLEDLLQKGLLERKDLQGVPPFREGFCDYERSADFKKKLLEKAWVSFKGSKTPGWDRFLEENQNWLESWCAFKVLKDRFEGKPWYMWPKEFKEFKEFNPKVVERVKEEFEDLFFKEAFIQFTFFSQWERVKRYAEEKGILIIGDLPLYVTHDSCDVWANRHLFELDSEGMPLFVAGVPPDYFSSKGQRWGNPLYRWEALKEEGYRWWIERIRHNLKYFHVLRLDHFRGFAGYWAIPFGSEDAQQGKWRKGPGRDFFEALRKRFYVLPFVAEDLGIITPDVRELMAEFGFPGMKVLQFAFGDDFPKSPYLPHNFTPNCFAYTGTHDNNTLLGWFEEELSPEGKQRVFKYLGKRPDREGLVWEMIRLLMASVAQAVIVPMQDVLGLPSSARLNIPSSSKGNWRWRLKTSDLRSDLMEVLKEMSFLYGRAL